MHVPLGKQHALHIFHEMATKGSGKLASLLRGGGKAEHLQDSLQRRNSHSVLPELSTQAVAAGAASLQGQRESQEDAHYAAPLGPSFDLYAVFDGHGGDRASHFCAKELPAALKPLLEKEPDCKRPLECLGRALRMLESRFLEIAKGEDLLDGTTACVVLLGEELLLHANIGDSEAVLSHATEGVVALSEVHNAARNEQEAARVLESGGKLFMQRLCHPVLAPRFCSIAVTRSIGDVLFKDQEFCRGRPITLLSEPFLSQRKRSPEDEFLIIGCDGVWDTLSHKQAVDIVRDAFSKGLSADQAAQLVSNAALEAGSQDNISAVIVQLGKKED